MILPTIAPDLLAAAFAADRLVDSIHAVAETPEAVAQGVAIMQVIFGSAFLGVGGIAVASKPSERYIAIRPFGPRREDLLRALAYVADTPPVLA